MIFHRQEAVPLNNQLSNMTFQWFSLNALFDVIKASAKVNITKSIVTLTQIKYKR